MLFLKLPFSVWISASARQTSSLLAAILSNRPIRAGNYCCGLQYVYSEKPIGPFMSMIDRASHVLNPVIQLSSTLLVCFKDLTKFDFRLPPRC